jgi:cell division protein FtsI/penicillin-binding protein 2
MTPQIRQTLLEAMDRVVWGPRGSARPTAIKALLSNPLLMRDYLALEHQMIGKTSTAEIVCNLSVNPSSPPQVYKHIWFGSIAFADAKRTDPELVVVVFLRYGDAGKEAAPLAAQMIHKWREIKKKHL